LQKQWVIPPQQNPDFVAHMEDVLEVYQFPYHPRCPQLCLDEQLVELERETREPQPMRPGQVPRCDYEYQPAGTAVNFLVVEPLTGWRQVVVRERKTARDWAEVVRELLEVDFPQAEKIVLVCDNLNTHKIASLYQAFPAEEAARLRRRLEIHYTPKHGSWLNIAEIELSAMTRQCLKRRIPDLETLRREVTHWYQDRNERRQGVKWQFTSEQARIKLAHLYPVFQLE
jgi:hypothetical protein